MIYGEPHTTVLFQLSERHLSLCYICMHLNQTLPLGLGVNLEHLIRSVGIKQS